MGLCHRVCQWAERGAGTPVKRWHGATLAPRRFGECRYRPVAFLLSLRAHLNSAPWSEPAHSLPRSRSASTEPLSLRPATPTTSTISRKVLNFFLLDFLFVTTTNMNGGKQLDPTGLYWAASGSDRVRFCDDFLKKDREKVIIQVSSKMCSISPINMLTTLKKCAGTHWLLFSNVNLLYKLQIFSVEHVFSYKPFNTFDLLFGTFLLTIITSRFVSI